MGGGGPRCSGELEHRRLLGSSASLGRGRPRKSRFPALWVPLARNEESPSQAAGPSYVQNPDRTPPPPLRLAALPPRTSVPAGTQANSTGRSTSERTEGPRPGSTAPPEPRDLRGCDPGGSNRLFHRRARHFRSVAKPAPRWVQRPVAPGDLPAPEFAAAQARRGSVGEDFRFEGPPWSIRQFRLVPAEGNYTPYAGVSTEHAPPQGASGFALARVLCGGRKAAATEMPHSERRKWLGLLLFGRSSLRSWGPAVGETGLVEPAVTRSKLPPPGHWEPGPFLNWQLPLPLGLDRLLFLCASNASARKLRRKNQTISQKQVLQDWFWLTP